jgi:hypothetical protein
MRNWVGNQKKTSRLCLRTLFRSSHSKFQVRGCSGFKTVALAPNALKQIHVFFDSPFRSKSVHYTLEHNTVQFISTFFPRKIISPNKKERLVDAWTDPVFRFRKKGTFMRKHHISNKAPHFEGYWYFQSLKIPVYFKMMRIVRNMTFSHEGPFLTKPEHWVSPDINHSFFFVNRDNFPRKKCENKLYCMMLECVVYGF